VGYLPLEGAHMIGPTMNPNNDMILPYEEHVHHIDVIDDKNGGNHPNGGRG